MKLLQSNVLGGPTQISIWRSQIAKGPTRQIKGGPGALVSRGDLNDAMNPNDAMTWSYGCTRGELVNRQREKRAEKESKG